MSKLEHLQTIFKQLSLEQQQTLIEFAEFLFSKTTKKTVIETKLLPRPSTESVIAAIKRLSKSYPMLDKAIMLDETSRLMTEHIIQGRDKIEVIDELETIFLSHYKKFTKELT
ncbi:Crp/Fnr family transcriptional regulator [Candidatus Halobeggiatoa sp. HSG11]|nr:Crp/Fnr family transcriptional regulator [Candidatus Halobeggiatoa sp. HSG11]